MIGTMLRRMMMKYVGIVKLVRVHMDRRVHLGHKQGILACMGGTKGPFRLDLCVPLVV